MGGGASTSSTPTQKYEPEAIMEKMLEKDAYDARKFGASPFSPSPLDAPDVADAKTDTPVKHTMKDNRQQTTDDSTVAMRTSADDGALRVAHDALLLAQGVIYGEILERGGWLGHWSLGLLEGFVELEQLRHPGGW
eukprot:CAMPEP_0173263922 /NCGR_PEP_ID=MMETSP1142-20121109/27668_1 /TAXON_ID=483371 /ORGANISM="non described non described, Strain CCMP2298" /LENGTH=135 /DNA_ID=CAMNT_0014199363 /DNA_START=136 /DNA_END=544 /DNA_ORIENTATION=+